MSDATREPARAPRVFAGLFLAMGAIAFASIAPRPGVLHHQATPMRIDLNAAGADELQLLPGIGPALAERIVADRLEHGAFATVEDLRRVRGVGERTVLNLRPFAVAGP